MQKINTGDGLFVDGNPSTGALGTILSAAWLNMVQAELISVLTAAGIVVDSSKSDQIASAIKLLDQQAGATYGADTGAANAYAVAYSPAITALTSGMVLRFASTNANAGASTFAPNGLAAKPIIGLALQALQGGEIAAGGRCVVMYSATLDSWILLSSAGGAMQVANATKSRHAVTLGQLQSGAALPAGIPLDWSGITPPSWAVVRDGSALARASYASLMAAICPTRSGTLTNGANTVAGLATTLDMWVGMPVEGNGVPAGATVASITSSSTITLSANATVSGAQTLTLFPFGYGSGGGTTTFGVPDDRGLHTRAYDSGRGYEQSTLTANTTNASNVLTGISSTRGLYVGMPVSGAGIPASTTIASITSATTATMSAAATATASAVALTVTGRQVGAEGGDATQNVTASITGVYMPSGTTAAGAIALTNNGSALAGGSSANAYAVSFDASRVARTGPETQVRRRTYLPIITLGA